MTSLDIVVAVYNEEECIPVFVDFILALDLPESVEVRIIFIEDSSTDNTLPVLRDLSTRHDCVSFYSLEKGFGQSAALFYGMTLSDADAVITMDVDDGHPMALIPELVRRHLDGADMVQAVRKDIKGRQAYRDLGTWLFLKTVKILTGVDLETQNVHYRLVSRDVKERITREKRWIYFLRFNFPASARPRTEYVDFESPERAMGESKYGFRRLLVLSARGILSLIPVGRFVSCFAAAGCVVCVLAWYRVWWLAAPLLAGLVAVLAWYDRIARNRIVESIVVKESSIDSGEAG